MDGSVLGKFLHQDEKILMLNQSFLSRAAKILGKQVEVDAQFLRALTSFGIELYFLRHALSLAKFGLDWKANSRHNRGL